MAYKSMRSSYYYGFTLLLFLVEVLGGALIKSIAVIFSFLAAFAVTSITFIFPSIFFIIVVNKYCSDLEKEGHKRDIVGSWIMIVTGIFVCWFSLYAAIAEVV